jgi:hypothetical protein
VTESNACNRVVRRARYSQGFRCPGTRLEGRGEGSGIAECRTGALVIQYSQMSKTGGADEAESMVGSSEDTESRPIGSSGFPHAL